MRVSALSAFFPRLWILGVILLAGCARAERRMMEVTAYCGCRECCGWERGRWRYLKLNFWDRYVSEGPRKGEPYSGRTASGTKPRQYDPGLFSADSIRRPWMIPVRIALFPWLVLPQSGTIAADTRYYPFGTRIVAPGYGRGIVEDRGSAICGPDRLDAFFRSHCRARQWGRRRVEVEIRRRE